MAYWVHGRMTYTASGSTPGYPSYSHTYSWVFDDGGTSNEAVVHKIWDTVGNHTATVVSTNVITGTHGTASVTVNLQGVPTISSLFNTDADGWTVLNDGTIAWNALGYITIDDLSTGLLTYASAPSKFLGDKDGYYGGSISFSIRIRTAPLNNAVPGILILTNGTDTISINGATPTLDTWCDYSFVLSTTSDWRYGSAYAGDPAATEGQIRAVLGGLTKMMICTEYTNMPDHTDLDTVIMAGA